TVTLPLSTPGIIAGVTTAFAWTFSEFATPQLIGGGRVNMVANLVYQLGFASFNFPFAASLSAAGLALTFAVLALMRAAAGPLEKIGLHCDAALAVAVVPAPAGWRHRERHSQLFAVAGVGRHPCRFQQPGDSVVPARELVVALVRQGDRVRRL